MAESFPKLVITAGPDEGREFAIPHDEVIRLGRAQDNGVLLLDSSVSRRHAAISPRDGKYLLQDLESRNGTFWQGKQIPPETEQELHHLDTIETGIYQFRFLEKNATPEELARPKSTPQNQMPSASQDSLPTTPPVPDQSGVASDKPEVEFLLDDILKEDQVKAEQKQVTQKQNRRRLTGILVLLLLLTLIVAGVLQREEILRLAGFENTPPDELAKVDVSQDKAALESAATESAETPAAHAPEDAKTTTPAANAESPERETQATSDVSVISATPAVSTANQDQISEVQVFLDVKTTPLPATIYFQDKRLGVSPLRETVSIKPNQIYDVYADFELRDINDIYRKKASLQAKTNTDVIELNMQGEIGALKIMKLPRNIEFYLEGFYEYDQTRSRPIKITDIVYGKPVYLPFGKYRLELREWESVSGSDNKISQIKFQREYTLNAQNSTVELLVTDADLREFPVVIKSDPPNAEVVLDGQVLGQTPFTGKLPVGLNRLTVRKDGFFDKAVDVEMRFNSTFETQVVLKTSKVGELINDAKTKLRADNLLDAINTLAEALKYGGSAVEKAEVYYLLGDTYLAQKQFEQAEPYFEKARGEPKFAKQAALGLAKVRHALGDFKQAMALTVEVLVNLDDQTPSAVRAEANAIFKKISPIKSVIYIYTEPAGANVFLNDKKLSEPTPIILSDLGLGSYRIDVEKTGFESYKTKQNLKLGEFSLIKIQLKPLQF